MLVKYTSEMKIASYCYFIFFIALLFLFSLSIREMRLMHSKRDAQFQDQVDEVSTSSAYVSLENASNSFFTGSESSSDTVKTTKKPSTPPNLVLSKCENCTQVEEPDLISFENNDEKLQANGSKKMNEDDESFNFERYWESIYQFKYWINGTVRKLRMLHDLYRAQNQTDFLIDSNMGVQSVVVQRTKKKLANLQATLAKHNSANTTYFLLLFHLERFLSNTPSSILVMIPEINDALCHLLESWLQNACFLEEKYDSFKVFLKLFFQNGIVLRNAKNTEEVPSLKTIFEFWKNSLFYTGKRRALIDQKRDYTEAFYFSCLKDQFSMDLEEAAFPLKSLTDIGQTNISEFHDFLKKYEIPFSGPYKRLDIHNPILLYFISSCNPADAIVNNNLPLYGCFEFRLKSLHLPARDAFEFWEKLEKAPYWLTHYPPIFDLTLEPLREQLDNIP